MLQVGQKINAPKDFIHDIYYDAQGKNVMCSLLDHFQNGTLLTDFVNQQTSTDQNNQLSPKEYLLNEVRKYLNKHLHLFEKEAPRPTRTGSDGKFEPNLVFDWIQIYINKLWEGIEERLTHFDSDGTTSWSEAPLLKEYLPFCGQL